MTQPEQVVADGPRRRWGSRTLSWSGIVLASAVLLLSAPQAWVQITAEGGSTSLDGTTLTGGLSQALAVVPPLALLLSLTLRARGRQVLGVLLVLVGGAGAVLGLRPPRPGDAEVQAALSTVSLADTWQTGRTAWPVVFGLAAVLLVVAAAVMVLRAPRWPSRAARYESATAAIDPEDPAAAWRAMDRGDDPTEAERATAEAPISPDPPGGATMDPEQRPEGGP